ncbi:lectin like domain-containing protein [Candidatus Soleaferrea massiliensis]|uniref:lectin like domain-containing protein n=1 Tax=Candidatus Soleaferrea massiliensis TaxID=1470354 RepID=UPI0005909369|nr:lectin like domain-containing protein [Candidatus Soleaferrea massiliensis]
MKHDRKRFKRLLSLLAAGSVLLSGSALPALADKPASPDDDLRLEAAQVNEEYIRYLENGTIGGAAPSMLDLSYLNERYTAVPRARAALPSSYDLRDYGLVSPVRNQGSWGTCWTFSALGSAESGLLGRFPHTSLSNLHLNWFSYIGDEEEEYSLYMRNGRENTPVWLLGGNDPGAVSTLAAWKGAISSGKLPYDESIDTVDETLRYDSDYHLQNAFFLGNGYYGYVQESLRPDTETVKTILTQYGAVSVSYCSSNWDTLNQETFAWYNDEPAGADHAVLIAGWDDDYPKENFVEGRQPQNNGAWLVRNSWGNDWGNDGYFWLSYEDKSIDMGSFYQMEANDNYLRNYQHDVMGWSISLGFEDSTENSAYISNIFTAQDDEQVEAVSFYTTDVSTQYEIAVYTGLKNPEDPTSGRQLTETQYGTEIYAGYHTVKLDEPVPLEDGEDFSIVVKVTNPSYHSPIAAEACPLPEGQDAPQYMGSGGESFISPDSQDWSDVYRYLFSDAGFDFIATNVCVKAFTNPVSTVSFSQMEGPIAFGEQLELTAPGADAIYYTTDGSDPTSDTGIRYNAPIEIDREMTVRTAAVKDGVFGKIREKTYTQAASELVELVLEQEGQNIHLDLSDNRQTFDTHVTSGTQAVRVQPQGSDSITVNGVPVDPNSWSQEIPLTEGTENEIVVQSELPGKRTTTYTLSVYRSALRYDYRAETAAFDEGIYSLTDTDGHEIHSGDSITPYILETGDSILNLYNNTDGTTHLEYVPNRQIAVLSDIDYANECTVSTYGEWNLISTSPDMSDAVKGSGEQLQLTPGVNLYIQRYATDTAFQSYVKELAVPARPGMPADPGIDFRSETTRDVLSEDILYSCDIGFAEAQPGADAVLSLTPGETVYLRTADTDDAFASEIRTLEVPKRPETPPAPAVESAGNHSITLKSVTGAQYAVNGGGWQDSPVFDGLEADTDYTFSVRIAATDWQFASFTNTAVLRTAAASSGSSDPVVSEPDGSESSGGSGESGSSGTASGSKPVKPNPGTGDSSVLPLFILMLGAASAAGILTACRRSRR